MYLISRERMSKYTKIVFTEVPVKYEPLLPLLEDISVAIVPGNINWIKDNRKSNSCELKELLEPINLFTGYYGNSVKGLSWEIPFHPQYGNLNVTTQKTYASNTAFKLNKDTYGLIMGLWSDHEKSKDTFKKKKDQARIERNKYYYDIIKKSDYLSMLDIYNIIA